MKIITIISTMLFLCCLVCCTSNNTSKSTLTNIEKEALKKGVELVDKTEYNEDSTFKVIYQIEKNTGKKYGIYKEYNVATNNLIAERNYKEDKQEGVEKIYFPNGQVDGEFNYKNGVHDGTFKYYYEDGTLKQKGIYINGQIEGVLNSYYPTGALMEEVTHENSLSQGPFKEYNENGTIRAEGKYTSKYGREDLEEGALKMYDEEGILIRKMICKEGQCCTIWTLEEGDITPKTKLCDALLKSQSS